MNKVSIDEWKQEMLSLEDDSGFVIWWRIQRVKVRRVLKRVRNRLWTIKFRTKWNWFIITSAIVALRRKGVVSLRHNHPARESTLSITTKWKDNE